MPRWILLLVTLDGVLIRGGIQTKIMLRYRIEGEPMGGSD
jgi:hypothetical protein